MEICTLMNWSRSMPKKGSAWSLRHPWTTLQVVCNFTRRDSASTFWQFPEQSVSFSPFGDAWVAIITLPCINIEHVSSQMVFTSTVSLYFWHHHPRNSHTQVVPSKKGLAGKQTLYQQDEFDCKWEQTPTWNGLSKKDINFFSYYEAQRWSGPEVPATLVSQFSRLCKNLVRKLCPAWILLEL